MAREQTTSPNPASGGPVLPGAADARMPAVDEASGPKGVAGAARLLVMPLAARLSYAVYRRYFEIVRADTPELRDEVYRLRYQVYVEEHGFERAEDFPDKRERDRFDARSLHVLLRHRASGTPIGTARLVRPDYAKPLESFPIQAASDHPVLHNAEVALYAAELSRLAISKRRLKECGTARGPFAWATLDPARRTNRLRRAFSRLLLPYLSVGLIAGVIEMAAEKGYPILYTIMEPFLIANMSKIGVNFPVIGEAVEYHGLRHPAVLPSLADAIGELKKRDRAAWEIITNRGRTQALALDAELSNPPARRAVMRAFHLSGLPVPVQLETPKPSRRRKKKLAAEPGPSGPSGPVPRAA